MAREEQERLAEESRARQAAAAEAQRLRQARQRERAERQAYLDKRAARKAELQVQYDAYEGSVSEAQKKVKRLTKKLRDIEELEKRRVEGGEDFKLSKEQRAKLERKQEVEDDIAEAEEEEEALQSRREAGEFSELLQWVPDEPLLPEEEQEEPGEGLPLPSDASGGSTSGAVADSASLSALAPPIASGSGCAGVVAPRSFAAIAGAGGAASAAPLPTPPAPAVSDEGGKDSNSGKKQSEEEEWATVSKPNKKKNKQQRW
jgi:hypothetical protein